MILQKKMAIIDAPRWRRTNLFACRFLEETNQSRLPIRPLPIAQSSGIVVRTYQELAKYHHVSLEEVICEIGSREGCSYYKPNTGRYFIFYNLKRSSAGRIKFTLMHELGHIYLRHFIDFGLLKLAHGFVSEELDVLDKEAEAFASAVLAPAVVLRQLKWCLPSVIEKNCGISKEAAGYRAKFVKCLIEKERYYLNKYEPTISHRFQAFIHQHYCSNCGSHFVYNDPKYCPICGSQNIFWGDGELVYDGIAVDSKGKALVCPICKNEEIHPEYSYCKICGSDLQNECNGAWESLDCDGYQRIKEPCGTVAEGNARYCVKCGCQTTFFSNGLLKAWNSLNEPEDGVASNNGISF